MKGIKRFSPEPLHVLCRKGYGDFMIQQKLADKVYEADKKSWRQWNALSRQIRKETYHFVLSPHQSVRTALLIKSLRAEKKIGFKSWWNGPVFDERIERPMHLPDSLRQLSVLGTVDRATADLISGVQSTFHNRAPLFESVDLITLPEWSSMTLRKTSFEKIAFIAPGSTWITKRWTKEGFIRVGRNFIQRGYKVLIIGSIQENDICSEIAGEIPGSENHSGKTDLNQLLELLARGQVLIANDSGLMHMGSLAGIPTVAIFGPTTLELGYRPWQNQALVVEAELSCRPCGKHGHQKCPIGTHDCMKKISAEEVIRVADLLINK
jgi:heptosyltransferase II